MPWCLDPLLALTNSVQSTSDYFKLTVRVSAKLCSPMRFKFGQNRLIESVLNVNS